jgi:hypothetical protein
MENIEEENYMFAIIDSENNVVNIIILDSDNDESANYFAIDMGAERAISCKKFGLAKINGKWNNDHFIDEDGEKVPFIAKPLDKDNLYEYNEDTKSWINIGPNIFKDFF